MVARDLLEIETIIADIRRMARSSTSGGVDLDDAKLNRVADALELIVDMMPRD